MVYWVQCPRCGKKTEVQPYEIVTMCSCGAFLVIAETEEEIAPQDYIPQDHIAS